MVCGTLLPWLLLWRDGIRLTEAVAVGLNLCYWLTGETVFRTAKGGAITKDEFKGTMKVNTSQLIGLAHAVAYVGAPLAALLTGQRAEDCAVCTSLVVASCIGGWLLRWTAMNTLGRFFTRQLRVQEKQTIVSDGPYAYVRHPGYAANALTITPYVFASCGNMGVAAVIAAIWLSAVIVRIHVEEEMLLQFADLAEPYKKYSTTVRHRLIPGIY